MGCILAVATTSFGQGALGEVDGTIRDAKTNQTIFGAHVYIHDNDRVYQTKTDPGGSFRISAIPAGTYLLNIKYYDDTMKNIVAEVPMDGICRLGELKFDSKITSVVAVNVSADKLKLNGDIPVTQITYKEIQQSAAKFDQSSMIAYMTSDVKLTDDGELVFRGARKGDMLYMMDGIKSDKVGTVPSCAIGRMTVYSGGLPAKYGDTTGGAVIMETLSYFDLYREWVGEQIKAGKM